MHQHVDGAAAGEPDIPGVLVADAEADDALAPRRGCLLDALGRGTFDAAATDRALEAAVGRGRSVEELIAFLQGRARGEVPQNVLYSLSSWAGSVTFATLERGVLLRANDEAALDRILAFPEMEALVIRRIGSSEALLKDAPSDKKLLAALRERGIELQGP